MSHPVWVRGLKPVLLALPTNPLNVAPRVGAWIETTTEERSAEIIESHPVWVRGLKPLQDNFIKYYVVSHPVWVRGLKRQGECREGCRPHVAPRVGAWIETT